MLIKELNFPIKFISFQIIGRIFKALALIIFSISLLACGGGSGGSSDSSGSDTAILNMSAQPNTISSGESATITWQALNSVSCRADGGWTSDTRPAGSAAVGPMTQTTVFSMSCLGKKGGPISESITVTVDDTPAPPRPTLSLTADMSAVNVNESTTIRWNSTNTTSCSATGGWTSNPGTSGSQFIASIPNTITFSMTCSGNGGAISRSVTVTVNNVPPMGLGTAQLSWTPPTTNEDGSALTDLDGYKIYQGTSVNNLAVIATLNNEGLSNYLVENLQPGTYYFSVSAFDSTGNESAVPNTVSKTIN